MEDNLILTTEPCCVCDTAPVTEPVCDMGVQSQPNPAAEQEQKSSEEEERYLRFVKLAAVLQDSVLHSWKLHLKAKKHSVHVILEEYYDDALDMVDALIEHYQGTCQCDIIDTNIVPDIVKSDEPFTYFTNLKDYLLNFINFDNFTEKTLELKSDIDDILRLIDSTLYKLGHLTESKIKSFAAFVYEDLNNKRSQ